MIEFATENVVDPAVHVYVPRDQDEQLLAAIERKFTCHLQGSRMSGKSSLLLRTAERLRAAGIATLYADLNTVVQAASEEPLDTMRRLLATLARRARLPSPACLDDPSLIVPADLLAAGLAEFAAQASAEPREGNGPQVVVLLDELDSIAPCPWATAFLTALRDLGVRRAADEDLTHVRVVLAGVRPFRHLVADPAEVGIGGPDATIWLDDFPNDTATAAALQQGFPSEVHDAAPALAWKALEFSGGYPQACTWLCRAMVREEMAAELADLEPRLVRLAERERRSPQPAVFFSYPEDYLRSYAQGSPTIADRDPRGTALDALWVYLDLFGHGDVPFLSGHSSHELLRWAGLARADQTGMLRPRSPLLARFYTSSWARELRRSLESSRVWTAAPQPGRARKLPRVCVLTTGGTIGMLEETEGKVRAPAFPDLLAEAYGAVREVANVEYVQALDGMRDSANVVPHHWSIIAERVGEAVSDRDIAGVVVTHGTDTLAYTASAVAYALGSRLTKPVVFTGSQATPDVPHGDALSNLLRACKLAAEAGPLLPEVAVCFGDKVLRACRAQKKDDRRFDAFESPLWPPLAVITEEIEYNDAAIRRHNGMPPPLDLRPDFDSRILTVVQVPGLLPRLLEPVLDVDPGDDGVRGVLIQSLGAGNLPTEAGYSLISFIERAVERDIPVVLGSPYPVLPTNPEKYEPAEAAIHAGALPLFNITLSALVTKLAWTLGGMPPDLDYSDPRRGRRREWVKERIRTNYVGETDDERLPDRIRRFTSHAAR